MAATPAIPLQLPEVELEQQEAVVEEAPLNLNACVLLLALARHGCATTNVTQG